MSDRKWIHSDVIQMKEKGIEINGINVQTWAACGRWTPTLIGISRAE
jgi:hypothetical protein